MPIKLIPLSRLETDPARTLAECLESGEPIVVEMPDHRLVSIQALDVGADDELTSELLETNPGFRSLVEKSRASVRKPFGAASG